MSSRKLQTGQPPYTLLVANLRGGSDPSKGVAGNPEKIRTGFTYQHFPEVQRVAETRGTEPDPSTPGVDTKLGLVDYSTDPVPVLASADMTVADNDFTAPAVLQLGQFKLISDEDFTVGGSAAATATALAAAISALPGYTATPAGADITVEGPPGPGGNFILLEATYDGAIQNYTLPDSGTLSAGEPTIGPPEILP